MERRVAVLFVLLTLLLGGRQTVAQPDADPLGLLGAMRDAYERLDYETAERRAREALDMYEAYSADQLVEVHTTLGLIHYAQSEPLEAREQFEAALSLDPALELDPLLASPKTLEFFEEVRASLTVGGGAERAPIIRYVRVHDPRPAATVRSVVLPGWGQLYKGERVKGWALVGLWTAAATGAVAAHVLRSQARSDYLAATDPDVIAERYDTYNAWHRARAGFAIGAAVVWGYAAFDALATGAPEQQPVQIGPAPGAGLSVRVRF